MAHLVKPTAYRAGKTYAWQHNVLVAPGETTLAAGLNKVSKFMLKRKRLYMVNGLICGFLNKKILYNLLFAPKIKTRPRERFIGAFTRRVTFKPYRWDTQLDLAKIYVDRRQEKTAKIRRRGILKINKWLSKRMFRGASKINWKSRKLVAIKPSRLFHPLFLGNVRPLQIPRLPKRSREVKKVKINGFVYPTWTLISGTPQGDQELEKVKIKGIAYKLRRNYCTRTHRFNKWKYDRIKKRRFNNRVFSSKLSNKLRFPIKARALNIFSYLNSKNMLTYKTHQQHFWHFKYRRYRFQYKNYYDIVNGFFVLSLVDHSENFILSVLRITLPQILKIKKFYRFLDTIIKNMPSLREKYSIFKISVTGKLAGGTKRTKFHSIGYGILPMQTLTLGATNKFLAYTHIYGEFGLKLLMCKDPELKKISYWR